MQKFTYDEAWEQLPFFSSFAKGKEVFDEQMGPLLRLWARWAAIILGPVLSLRCYHHQGGAKKCLSDLKAFIQPGDFVYKTDVCSYYASISHTRLYAILYSLDMPIRFIYLVANYCTRCITGPHEPYEVGYGIAKGGALSPILGAVFLCPLDRLMEKWMLRGDVFYARFQDDLIIVARKKFVLKRAIHIMRKYLDTQANMGLRREKTFIGRACAGFDFLGYRVTPIDLAPNDITISRASDKAKRCYAQKGATALAGYLKRWKTWVYSGLKNLLNETVVERCVEGLGLGVLRKPE